jgi:PfaB family protein
LGLFVVQGRDRKTLLSAAQQLHHFAGQQDARRMPVDAAAGSWFQKHPLVQELPFAAVLLAHDLKNLAALTHEARQAVETNTPRNFGSGGGVCYRTAPLGGDLAFVYPGSGNHYAGMGREIALYWPDVLRRLDAGTRQLKSQFRPEVFVPQRHCWKSDWEDAAKKKLLTDPLNPIIGPVAFGCMTTALMQCLSINPRAVIGYSLGEVTGLIAMQAWPDRDAVLERMLNTDLFHTHLSGPCLAARQAWGLGSRDTFNWRTVVVNRPAETVRTALQDLPTARLLIVNTPDECVVGGNQNQVETLIRRLDCQAIDLEGVTTVHCDALAPVAETYRSLHEFPTVSPQGVRFYSCSSGRAYAPATDSAAASILSQGLHGFEFPPTIEQAYADGVRIFLELGPGTSCSRMIRHILGDRPHLSQSLDVPGADGVESVLRGIGALISERVPLNLEWLYPKDDASRFSTPDGGPDMRDIIEISVGGKILSPARPDNTVRIRPAVAAPDILPAVSSPVPEGKQPATGVTGIGLLEPQRPPQSDSLPIGGRVDQRQPVPVVPESRCPQAQLIDELTRTTSATATAHKQYLDFSTDLIRAHEEAIADYSRLAETLSRCGAAGSGTLPEPNERSQSSDASTPMAYDRQQCLEFATGSVAEVLGPEFAPADTYKTRVRLPAEPLMLVDRIVSVDGVKGSLTSGRLITEHDVLTGAWYLDGNHAPVCIAVEAGQADLFLCSYLGIDLAVKGERVYRLLDASVVFHRELPCPGETIRYEIKIEKFIRQGPTYLFFFRFEGTIDNQPLISMTNGCAGFFTEEEIQNSGGIIPTTAEHDIHSGRRDPQWTELVPQAIESYADDKLDALRTGNLAACFGHDFDGIVLAQTLRIPGGRMKLIDRIQRLDPQGGRYGLGSIRAEADIQPDDWFLTCHFVDDMTMPGTLMYECCAHTLRVFLQRMGWVTDRPGVHYDTVPGVKSVLRCRGPVTPRTRQVIYEVELKEIGYGPEPYALADAHMYADGRYIVRFTDMAIRMSGLKRETLENDWKARIRPVAGQQMQTPTSILFDRQRILTFATGKPSEAFGDRYAAFDTDRFLARLPAPPYSFIDRVIKAEPEAWQLKSGGWVEAEFDVRPDDWYFKANRSDNMPYCVLLEIALQACGWLAAYAGSALRSPKDLRFRNLDGQAILHRDVRAVPQTLKIRCRMTKVSTVEDIIIESFEFQVFERDKLIYDGNTVFGFFTAESLSNQKGIQADDGLLMNDGQETGAIDHGVSLPDEAPLTPDDTDSTMMTCGLAMPAKALRMIDRIEICRPTGGPHGLGYLRATKKIDPAEWFFAAHFHQDPVCPGSLGIESFIQLLKYEALRRWTNLTDGHRFEPTLGIPHTWQYRGQIVPQNRRVEVEAFITSVKNEPVPELRADGILKIDGLAIYHMKGYGIRIIPL